MKRLHNFSIGILRSCLLPINSIRVYGKKIVNPEWQMFSCPFLSFFDLNKCNTLNTTQHNIIIWDFFFYSFMAPTLLIPFDATLNQIAILPHKQPNQPILRFHILQLNSLQGTSLIVKTIPYNEP